MNQGKPICETLKAIRKKIADANDIPYAPIKCALEDDCLGTCPTCESEMRYIEDQLNIRKMAGKAVKIVGLATMMSLSACNSTDYNQHLENKQIETEVWEEEGIIAVDQNAMMEPPLPPDSFNQEGSDTLFAKAVQSNNSILKNDSLKYITIKGVVKDTNEPLPFANIAIKDMTNGIETDMDGNYKIVVPENVVLEFSSAGYMTKYIKVTEKTPAELNVTLVR